MDCPYRGLYSFREQDTDLFFGRDRFLLGEEKSQVGLIQTVQMQPLVAVVGSSGSGKSSVVFAGLIPQLRAEGIWLIDSFRPHKQPFYELASALVRLLKPELDAIQQPQRAAELMAGLTQGQPTLLQVASDILRSNPGKRLLLVVDQFEEIYTLCSSQEQQQFIDALLDAISLENLTLVLTLRADFCGYVLSYPPLGDALRRFGVQLLTSMNQVELQAAIEKPLAGSGVSLEDRLTQRILDDVGREPGNLPLLEFALTRLWKQQQQSKLTHRAYGEIGGVKQALANHAEEIYSRLSQEQKKQAEQIFVQLVHPGNGTEDTRRLATRAEVGEENWALVTELASYKARLVVTGWNQITNEDTVEVVHEALIREWKTLHKWVTDNRRFRTWQESLRFAISTWENSGQDKGQLLRGSLLAEAEAWLDPDPKQKASAISHKEAAFIQESVWQRQVAQTIKYGLLMALAGLLLIALNQFLERRFQEQLTEVLIGGSVKPELLPILPKALEIAKRQDRNNNVDAAIESYKAVLRATDNFDAASKETNAFQTKDMQGEIKETQKHAEDKLAALIQKHYFPELEKQLENKQFGQSIGGVKVKLTDFQNRFTEGTALKTTYRILMRKPGLGVDERSNNNGRLDDNEVIYLPCATLKEINNLWRVATKKLAPPQSCGLYGKNIYEDPNCALYSQLTISNSLLDTDAAALDAMEKRIKDCPNFKDFNP